MASKEKQPFCGRCHGTGVVKVGQRPQPCHCGRAPNASGAARLAKAGRLDERLRHLKAGGQW